MEGFLARSLDSNAVGGHVILQHATVDERSGSEHRGQLSSDNFFGLVRLLVISLPHLFA